MVEVLALVLHHDEQTVLVAVELALEDGVPPKIRNWNHSLPTLRSRPSCIRTWRITITSRSMNCMRRFRRIQRRSGWSPPT
jgi:hypothetical protein